MNEKKLRRFTFLVVNSSFVPVSCRYNDRHSSAIISHSAKRTFHERVEFQVSFRSSDAQCVVEVGATGIILDSREQEAEVEQNGSTTNDVITTMGTITEEVGSLEVAFLYDAPMREMTVRFHGFQSSEHESSRGCKSKPTNSPCFAGSRASRTKLSRGYRRQSSAARAATVEEATTQDSSAPGHVSPVHGEFSTSARESGGRERHGRTPESVSVGRKDATGEIAGRGEGLLRSDQSSA